jgi:hypothetical protein
MSVTVLAFTPEMPIKVQLPLAHPETKRPFFAVKFYKGCRLSPFLISYSVIVRGYFPSCIQGYSRPLVLLLQSHQYLFPPSKLRRFIASSVSESQESPSEGQVIICVLVRTAWKGLDS